MRLSLLALLLLLASPAAAQDWDPRFEPGQVSEVPGRDGILLGLGTGILEAVQRHDTRWPVFHGCIDWHSAVHGHWALLRIDRVTGRGQAAAAWVERNLTPAGIAAEREHLRRDPRFERPYGRAWFLRLALEFEDWARERGVADPARLRALADELAAGLLAGYERHLPPATRGSYHSPTWALAQLHAWYAHRQDDAERARVEALVAQGFADPQAWPRLSFAEDAERPDFFSREGGWLYLLARAGTPQALERHLAAHPLGQLDPVQPLAKKPHHFGMNWSRAWALRALERRVSDPALRHRLDVAYRAHVRAGLAAHAAHADDYRAYGHWVAQFAVYALSEGERVRFFH